MIFSTQANQVKGPFILPDLPFAKDALVPHMSPETFDYHHAKHHNAYVVNLNKLLEGSDMLDQSLEEIILASSKSKEMTGIFNNAAQVWNHSFFWHSMKAKGSGKPSGALLAKINEDFGSFEKFLEEFKQAGATQFGSGWAWLVLDGNKLKVTKTANAETPITQNMQPLLTCDVWEHAYYVDYRNRRPDYLSVFLDHLANWEFAESNFAAHSK